MQNAILLCAAQTTRFDFLSMIMTYVRHHAMPGLWQDKVTPESVKIYIEQSVKRRVRCQKSPLKVPCVVLPLFSSYQWVEAYPSWVESVVQKFASYLLAEVAGNDNRVVNVTTILYKGTERYVLLSLEPDANHIWSTCIAKSKTVQVLHQTTIF